SGVCSVCSLGTFATWHPTAGTPVPPAFLVFLVCLVWSGLVYLCWQARGRRNGQRLGPCALGAFGVGRKKERATRRLQPARPRNKSVGDRGRRAAVETRHARNGGRGRTLRVGQSESRPLKL